MQLIDRWCAKMKRIDLTIDRGKIWLFSTRKRSYVVGIIFVDIVLCWHYLPLFFSYGWLGLQPFKLFGVLFGGFVGECLYRSVQYYKRGNPLNLSGRQFQNKLFRLCIKMFVIVVLLALIQGMVELYLNINLVWLTGVGTRPRI